jgi:hypothetical protein
MDYNMNLYAQPITAARKAEVKDRTCCLQNLKSGLYTKWYERPGTGEES